MSIEKCPSCGSDVSSEAAFCSRCGTKLVATSAMPDVAEEPVAQIPTAPNAPEPIPEPNTTQTSNSPNVKNKTLLIVIAAAVVIIAALAIGYTINEKREQARIAAEAEAQRVAEIEEFNQYIDDLNECMYLMISGAANAEGLCNTTVNVWSSAIFEDSQDAWDEEIRQYYANDFNDALNLLYSDQGTQDAVAEIESNQEQVNVLFRRLQNPPEGLGSAYDTLEDMYDSYLTLTNLAASPTGSLQSYRDAFHEADQECVDAFEKLQTKIPDKKEV